MTESTQPADLSKSAPAVDMSPTFSARVMNLPADADANLPSGCGEAMAYKYGHRDARHGAAEIAAEADALAEAARGLRVALLAYVEPQYEGGTDNGASLLKQARAALAAFVKAAGGAA